MLKQVDTSKFIFVPDGHDLYISKGYKTVYVISSFLLKRVSSITDFQKIQHADALQLVYGNKEEKWELVYLDQVSLISLFEIV